MSLPALRAFCLDRGLAFADEQEARLEAFQADLYETNRAMNLTRVPEEEAEVRHLVDSLLVERYLPVGSSVLDVGTGAGFPAIPLAVVRPDLQVCALDSSSKAMRLLARHVLPNLRLVEARAEDFDEREVYEVVTGRAVAPLPAQLEISAAFCRVDGAVVPFRVPAEMGQVKSFGCSMLGLTLESCDEVPLPGTDAVRLLPVFRKVRPTPGRYPRRWAEIRNKPLA
jgi:16S rRNA (guanine527-N7)-methyltransferase